MKKLFAVRDVKADTFGAPMAIPTEGLAVRSFTEAVLAPNSDLAKYKEDYMLYEIGTYEPNCGLVTALPVPRFIVSASSVYDSHQASRAKVEPELPGVEA